MPVFLSVSVSFCTRGIPVPTPSISTFCLSAESQKSFVHKVFISDRDEVHYKIEASGDWPVGWRLPFGGPLPIAGPPEAEGTAAPLIGGASKASNENGTPLACPACAGRPEWGPHSGGGAPGLRGVPYSSCLERGTRPLQRVPPTQLLIYVSYPYCENVWDAGASGKD